MRRLEYISTKHDLKLFQKHKKTCLESRTSISLHLTLRMERKEHCHDDLKAFPVLGPVFRTHGACFAAASVASLIPH